MTLEKLLENLNESVKKINLTSKDVYWGDIQVYTRWLANTHYYVKESSMMLALSASSLPYRSRKAANRFLKHATEEMGHESQLERDIKELGFNLKNINITNEMKICHRSLSYWGHQSCNAIGFLGWVLLIENLAVEIGPSLYTQVSEAFSGKGTNFLRSHSEDDPEHIEAAYQLLKLLENKDLEVISDAIKMYTHQYRQFLLAINEKITENYLAA